LGELKTNLAGLVSLHAWRLYFKGLNSLSISPEQLITGLAKLSPNQVFPSLNLTKLADKYPNPSLISVFLKSKYCKLFKSFKGGKEPVKLLLLNI